MTLSIVRCRALGGAEIHTRGIRITPESDLQFGLALYFCAHPGRDVPRDDLARLFWPEQDAEAGRHCLRQALYRLRVLGVAVRSGVRSMVLEPHFIESDFAPVTAEGASAAAFLRLTDVSVLPGYAPRFSRFFARWVEEFRADVGTKVRRGLVRAISEMRARGRYGDVERLCRFCLQLDPLNEEATLALAESVALAGAKAEAVGMIDRYEGEVGRYRPDLRVPASLLRERISDRLLRRNQAAIELPMIGREADVERVLGAFQRLRGNRAVSYVVTGAAGVGKTRLASECCRMAELQGARIVTIGTQPSSRTQALFAVSELVDGLLQMPGAIGCAPAALECLRAISSPVPMRESSLGLDQDGEARFAMVRWSILDVLEAILSEGPLVIHVDDAHQLDAQSQAILQDALRTHAARPLLVLCSMREPEAADEERFARFRAVSSGHELLPLSDESCGRLVERFCAVHEESLDPATRERIIQLSGGNAFFLVELLKHRSDLVSDELPLTVQALLEDRLRRLSPAALTVLRAAAVLGLSSSVERLQRVVERRTSDVLAALTELHAAGMLSASDAGTVCRHDTIREAVLERTPTAARVLLHRRAARTLGREALKEGGVSLLWDCVHHWRKAGAEANGVRLALVLTRRLLALGLARDALEVLTQISVTGKQAPFVDSMLRLKARAARLQRDWRTVTEAVSQRSELLRSEGELAPEHNHDELLLIEAAYNHPETFGSLPAGIIHCIRSRAAPRSHRLAAGTLAMISADNHGDDRLAQDVYSALSDLAVRTRIERVHQLTVNAVYHTGFGDLASAQPLLRELVSESLALKNPAARATHIRRACYGIARYDDPALAKKLLLQVLTFFEKLHLRTQSVLCIEDLGTIAISSGQFDEASEWISRAQDMRHETSDIFCSAVEYELRVMAAFEQQRADLLPDFDLPPATSQAFMRLARSRQHHYAVNVAVALLEKRTDGLLSELAELCRLHQLMGARGYQDFTASVLMSGLLAIGEISQASWLLYNYIETERRERTPLPTSLSRLTSELGRVERYEAARWPFLAPTKVS